MNSDIKGLKTNEDDIHAGVLCWTDLLADYVSNMDQYWPQARVTQRDKLRKCVDKIKTDFHVETDSAAVQAVVELAKSRLESRPLTIFLISAGSSGSHWLEAVLKSAADMIPCGEVYLPQSIFKAMRGLSLESSSAFLDCIHMIHAERLPADVSNVVFVNSAHRSGWRLAEFMSEPKKSIFLKRNPIDIVVSRSFRKPDYYGQFEQLNHAEFVDHNITYVQAFYQAAIDAAPDVTVSFEAMRQDLKSVLMQVESALDLTFNSDKVRIAVDELGYIPPDKASFSKQKTNVYAGPRIEVADATKGYIRGKLGDMPMRHGY